MLLSCCFLRRAIVKAYGFGGEPSMIPAEQLSQAFIVEEYLPGGTLLSFHGEMGLDGVAEPTRPGRSSVPTLVAGDELGFSATLHLRALAEALWAVSKGKQYADAPPSSSSPLPEGAAEGAAAVGGAPSSEAEPSVRLQLLWQRVCSSIRLERGRVLRASPARARGVVTMAAEDGSFCRATIDSLSPTLLHSLGAEWSSLRLIGHCSSQLPISSARWGKNSSWQVFIASSAVGAGADLRAAVHPAHRHVDAAPAAPGAAVEAGAAPEAAEGDGTVPLPGSPAIAAAVTASAAAADGSGRRRGRGGRGDLPAPVRLERGCIVEFSLVPPAGISRSLNPIAVRVFRVAPPRSAQAAELELAPPDHRLWFGPKPEPAKRPQFNARLRAEQSAAGAPRGGATNASAPSASGFSAGRGRGRGGGGGGQAASGVVPGAGKTADAAMLTAAVAASPAAAEPPAAPATQ
jgi:hypothetical protein